MPKVKNNERKLKESRKNQSVIDKGALMRLSADFSTETPQGRRDWHKTFSDSFPDKKKLRVHHQ